MFTGLISDKGAVARIENRGPASTFVIKTNYDTSDLELGESIAVDGACLTVVKIDDDTFSVDAEAETIRLTTLGDRRVGDAVHLERALRLSDRLGGHIVSGHVDGVGSLVSKQADGSATVLTFDAPPEVSDYLLTKGSVTIDGVSLTVNSVSGARFSVAIIPHTQDVTKLETFSVGHRVNLEADIVGKYVKKFVIGSGSAGQIDLDRLREYGFADS